MLIISLNFLLTPLRPRLQASSFSLAKPTGSATIGRPGVGWGGVGAGAVVLDGDSPLPVGTERRSYRAIVTGAPYMSAGAYFMACCWDGGRCRTSLLVAAPRSPAQEEVASSGDGRERPVAAPAGTAPRPAAARELRGRGGGTTNCSCLENLR